MSPATAALDPQQVRQWLDLLHGQAPGRTHICATGNWTGRSFDNLDQATSYVTQLHDEGCEGIYARVTTLRATLEPGRRGGAVDTAALPALWADLDLAGPGHAELNLPPDQAAGQQIIAITGLPVPTLWVHSGGGLYPIWLLDHPVLVDEHNLNEIKQLSTGWQRVIEHAAGQLGWHYGRGVGDLARVLRIPGTVNRKEGLARPCQVIDQTGPHYTLDQLHTTLQRALAAITPSTPTTITTALHVPPASRERTGADPGEDFNQHGDWATILEPAGWTLHNVVDGVGQWTRPGKDTGVSATTNALGTDRLHIFSTSPNVNPFVGGESYHKFAAYCVTPETNVLRANLTWAPAGDLAPGDALVGVDEYLPAKNGRRKLRLSYVEQAERRVLPCYRITLADGRIITATDEHPWLAASAGKGGNLRWIQTQNLRPGQRIATVTDGTWDRATDFDSGWLSGILDGEGWVNRTTIGIAQKNGPVLQRAKSLLEQRGFNVAHRARPDNGVHNLVINDLPSLLRLLGTLQPVRLVGKLPWVGRGAWTQVAPNAVVQSAEFVGDHEVAAFMTTTRTFIAEGLISHNTLLHHGGDFRAAARELAGRGFGDPLPPLDELQRADMDIILPGWRDQPSTPGSSNPGSSNKAGPASRYFTEGGSLLAQLLARDVLALGPLAVGGDDILWSYRDGVWTPERHVVRNRLTQLLGDRYRRTHAAHIEDIVRADCPVIDCDPIPNLINFRNGLLDWTTGDLRPHDPEVLSTVQLGVDWNPETTCPRFDQFLTEVVPTDVVPVVWELIGYLMMSGNPLHKAIMLMGTGRNGKGTLLRAIVALLGKRHVSAVSLQDLTSTRFSTVTLYGKIANIAGDIDATYLESTAIFKAITGQDQISAEHKGRDRFDFTPWAVPVFSANEIPPSADTSTGYLSRWLPIPFPHSFEGKEDRTLDAQLVMELPGIAARAIDSLRTLMKRGDFDHPPSITSALSEFAKRVDQVRSWLADCCEPIPPQPHDPAHHPSIPRTTIYEAYRRWCARDGHRPLAAAKFYDRLEGAGVTPGKVRGERGFRGITITDNASMLTQSQPGVWWPTSSDDESIKGAGRGQVGGSIHNANLPPQNSGVDLQQRLDDQDGGAEGAAFSNTSHVMGAQERTNVSRTREIAGIGEKLPHLPPPAPLIHCRVCGKPLDPVLAPKWHDLRTHPSCQQETTP